MIAARPTPSPRTPLSPSAMDGSSSMVGRRELSHKALRQRMERLEGSLNAVPRAVEDSLDALEAHCTAGVKLASLLETVFQDSAILFLALRYKESCEQLLDKAGRSGLALKRDAVATVKGMGPTLSQLRARIDSHAKAAGRHESHLRQLEDATLSDSPSKAKVEEKFRSSAQDFSREDRELAKALTDLRQLRAEVGGGFLNYLEAVSKVMEMASDLMAPLGSYKELRHSLKDSSSSSSSFLQEASVGWLAATQINQNLRSFGCLSRNDVQCMLYNHPDGLPEAIRSGLNIKVNQLIKLYSSELRSVITPHHVLIGGFHYCPKAIELALKDCCSELEAKGAGADHAHTLEAQAEQIARDVSRTRYRVGGREFGAATGEAVASNIAEKQRAVGELVSSFKAMASAQQPQQLLRDFVDFVLNESCTTVTNTAAKTAVQLVFGKANLVLVRPSPSAEDNKPIEISSCQSDGIVITVHSAWWLVEDYVAFVMLCRQADPDAVLGVVDATYTISLSLSNFCKETPALELPTIAVTYQQPASQQASPPQPVVGSREKEGTLSASMATLRNKFRSISQKSRGRVNTTSPHRLRGPSLKTYLAEGKEAEEEEEEEEERRRYGKPRTTSSHKQPTESEGPSDVTGQASWGGPSLRYSSGRADSFGRGMRPLHRYPAGLKRSESNDTLSSQSTLVPRPSFLEAEDHPLGIADLIHDSRQPTLTQSLMRAHDKSASRQLAGYRLYNHREQKSVKTARAEGEDEEEEEGTERRDDDRKTIEGSPSDAQISIASDQEMDRVLSFLSKRPGSYPHSHHQHYQPQQKEQREPGYSYGYGYEDRDYGGYSEGPGRRRKENGSSDSSGVEEHFSRASRSGSIASFHGQEEEGGECGRERGDGEGERPGGRPQGSSNASLMSTDSGIGPVGPSQARLGEREEASQSESNHLGPQELPFDFSKGLGSLISSDPHQRHPHSSQPHLSQPHPSQPHPSQPHPSRPHYTDGGYAMFDGRSPMEQSGRDSLPSSSTQSPVMFRTRSEENIRATERSASRASTHSMPYISHSHGSNTSLDQLDFDHTPGSRPHRFDYEDHLSQDSLEGHTHPYWDYHQKPHPGQFSRAPYSYQRASSYEYHDYQEQVHDHLSRPMQHNMRGHSQDYSPSTAPTMDRPPMDRPPMDRPPLDRPPIDQPPMDRPQPHFWPRPGYEGGYEQPVPRGPLAGGPMPRPLPPQGPGIPHPPGPHPMHDNRFRPVSFRPTTPSSPSPGNLPSMSPGPSPQPTPPATPPPPHSLPHPPPRGPPLPAPYHSPRGNHLHHGSQRDYPPPRDFHTQPPPPPPMSHQAQSGGPHGPPPPRGSRVGSHPPPFGLSPSPGPPPSGPPPPPVSMTSRFPPPPSWDRPWSRH